MITVIIIINEKSFVFDQKTKLLKSNQIINLTARSTIKIMFLKFCYQKITEELQRCV